MARDNDKNLTVKIGYRDSRRAASRILQPGKRFALRRFLLFIAVTGYLVEGFRIGQSMPEFEKWSPVGYGLGAMFAGMADDTLRSVHPKSAATIVLQPGRWAISAAGLHDVESRGVVVELQ